MVGYIYHFAYSEYISQRKRFYTTQILSFTVSYSRLLKEWTKQLVPRWIHGRTNLVFFLLNTWEKPTTNASKMIKRPFCFVRQIQKAQNGESVEIIAETILQVMNLISDSFHEVRNYESTNIFVKLSLFIYSYVLWM